MKQLSVRALSFAMASLIALSGLALVARPVTAATSVTLLQGADPEHPASTKTLANKIREAAGGDFRYVKSFQKGSNPPSGAIAIDENTNGNAVCWGVNAGGGLKDVYWYSSCDTVYLNADCRSIFGECKSLTTVDLTGLNSSKVTNMEKMFYQCKKLTKIKGLDNFNTSSVTSMYGLFGGCAELTDFSYKHFNTSKVENFQAMFEKVPLKNIDLSSYDTSSATRMSNMFNGCSNLETLKFGNKFVTSKVTNFSGMFNGCSSLKTIYATKDFDNSSEDKDYQWTLFDGCKNLVGGAGFSYIADNDYKTSKFARINTSSVQGFFTKYSPDPTNTPTVTKKPTATPTKTPTAKPTSKPTNQPTAKPSGNPTAKPTAKATATPTPKSSTGPSGTKLSMTLAGTVVCGKSVKAKINVTPSQAKVSFKSSNSKIATVDSAGNVKGVMAGKVTITATANGTKVSSSVQVLYKDVTSSKDFWYAPTNDLTNRGIVKGYDKQTKFKPANECTRAQMVTFIWRMQGEPAPKTKTCKFKDVKKTDYFYKACLWGNEKGIVEGYKNGTFGPKIVCARRHAVTFLWRLAGKPDPKSSKNKFKDVKKSDYFYKATLWASEKGILAGYKDGTFRPNGNCLRRQMVTFLYKYGKYVGNK
ncbi:MAG: BspA family leucine-rich repeat surface protein [Clostridiales bacterium]|nr:BspA family leucine-rich repeat surface protein [Clostridiales bacterium]